MLCQACLAMFLLQSSDYLDISIDLANRQNCASAKLSAHHTVTALVFCSSRQRVRPQSLWRGSTKVKRT